MVKVQGFMNLYRSGYYHRRGKPDGNINVHGGDIYLTRPEASDAAEPDRGYIATIPVEYVADSYPVPNSYDSVPINLSITRAEIAAENMRMQAARREQGVAWLAS